MADKEINKDNNKSTNNITNMEKERAEYFGKLEKWLHEAYAWHSVAATLPHYLMSGQLLHPINGTPLLTQVPGSTNSSASSNNSASQIGSNASTWQNNSQNRQGNRTSGPIGRPEGYEYLIPPIWKRIVAELIDSVMLFVLKLVITFVALDIFSAMNMELYTLDTLQSSLRIVDYKMAMDVASSILIWELMHRFIVCVFEAIWLQHGMNGRIGGATPGKSVMGLRVVQCRSITPIERSDGTEAVLVSPGTDLGLPLALGRSIVKNIIMTLVFPICFSLFSFRFNRTGYDLACHSLVVEDSYRTPNNNNNHLHQQ
ncbi:protein FAM8A1 [Chelonus insularis]|uniref:protein FAM8A1 n=1 Tax=Chelonus insularis TaxID=460826 RepID=UPI00158B06B9|nr:protein FAM8A1 [Chelonus insularis]XP_034947509.1 protein FAM8A1 [Chelonus insularis]